MKKIKNLLSVFLITILISLLSGCVATVSMPEIKEGRFNFSVTYSVNGELNTFKGVYVCEYDGVLITCLGASIEWKGYIENAGDIDIPVHTNRDGVVYINLGFYAEYFMDDPSAIYYNTPSPNLYLIYHSSTPDSLEITSEKEVIDNCGVKIISYYYDEPIKNTFNEQLSFGRFEPSIN